jgi:Na+/melibiose symporter-like transporter
MTSDYDERTSLAGYRMFFNLLATIAAAVIAPTIVDVVMERGGTQQQGYVLSAALFGVSTVIPYLLIFFTVRERPAEADRPAEPAFRDTLRTAW